MSNSWSMFFGKALRLFNKFSHPPSRYGTMRALAAQHMHALRCATYSHQFQDMSSSWSMFFGKALRLFNKFSHPPSRYGTMRALAVQHMHALRCTSYSHQFQDMSSSWSSYGSWSNKRHHNAVGAHTASQRTALDPYGTGHQSFSSGEVRGGVMRVWIASEKIKRSTMRQCSPTSPDAKASDKRWCNCVAKVAMVGCGVGVLDSSMFSMKLFWWASRNGGASSPRYTWTFPLSWHSIEKMFRIPGPGNSRGRYLFDE